MPYKTKTKKKTYKRKRKVSNAISRAVGGTVSGFPRSRKATLRYCDVVSITSTAGAIGSKVFACNSIFKPNREVGQGHQPLGHDQYSLLYDQYIVTDAYINVKCLPAYDNSSLCWWNVYVTDGSSVPYTTPSAFIEAKQGVSKMSSYHEGKSINLNVHYNTAKYFNIKDIKDNIQYLGASLGADPTEEANFNVNFCTVDGYTETSWFIVTIDYACIFTEPKDLAQS